MLQMPIIAILGALLLVGCSMIPTTPSVLVIPGTGKDFTLFHQDDQTCQQTVHTQLEANKKQLYSFDQAQQSYDIGYIQCMYSKGHRVPVPGRISYDSAEEWHAPPAPNTAPPPPPPQP